MSRTRTTISQLQAAANLLNRLTGNSEQPYTRNAEGKLVANVGNYHISQAYGGYCLHQMVNESGGVRDVVMCGHVPARQLFDLIHAYRYGIESVGGTK
jgi:hypothetical protein